MRKEEILLKVGEVGVSIAKRQDQRHLSILMGFVA